jgi:ferredoxin-type protein NapH
MFINRIKAIARNQKIRYFSIIAGCLAFIGPLAFMPQLAGGDDMCGVLCMRRFYLYYPGMTLEDLWLHMSVAIVGVFLLFTIFSVTFFNGRLWCSYVCPVGGMTELGSRLLNDRWKIEFRSLPQVSIRYGYLAVFILVMPMLGISACTFCNFITVPRLVEALSGEYRGLAFILSSVGLVNLALLFLLGFFANKGRAYCQFLCPIGAVDGVVNRIGSHFRYTHHIRVEHGRCSGCKVCAEKCMCGAIKMIDQIAVVDQFSCMSCHECVDVCDWNAIELTTGSHNKVPKRIRKNIDIHPEPDWQSISKPALRAINSKKKKK